MLTDTTIQADTFPSSVAVARRPHGARAQQQRLLEALNASPRALRRDECSDWTIQGTMGRIHTWDDGRTWVLAVTAPSARAWTAAKRRLAFCTITQDGDDEGCLRLYGLPNAGQAAAIREILGIRKRRQDSAATMARLQSRLSPRASQDALYRPLLASLAKAVSLDG